MKTLLVDNYDSYTYNLFQLIAEVDGVEPVVVRNDDPILATPGIDRFGAVVISPGPGRPQSPRDRGNLLSLLRRPDIPILGVCFGHQAIVYAAGGSVVNAPRARHGHVSRIGHCGEGLFAGIPQQFAAVRYHSLCAAPPLPPAIEATAWAEDGIVMAVAHRELPRWGVQFHPESIATEHGRQLLANFSEMGRRWRLVSGDVRPSTHRHSRAAPAAAAPIPAHRLSVRTLPAAIDCEQAFVHLFGAAERAFWLDSSGVRPGLSRFSFLGDASGPLSETLTYRVGSGQVVVQPREGPPVPVPGTVFDVLQERLSRLRVDAPRLPFGLACGYVGYFGYELKQDCGSPNRHRAETPDAAWMLADRLVAVDHQDGLTYLVALCDGSDEVERAQADWLCRTGSALARLPLGNPAPVHAARTVGVEPHLVRDRDTYLADIRECLRELVAGESYEICLTDQVRLPAPADDQAFYLSLRRANPAPYAAFLRLPNLAIFSSSPERFLTVSEDRRVESRPIKGTAARHPDPRTDEQLRAALPESAKTFAENLMIVDLLRNDLGRVCEVGSVSVPAFMVTESYATVHQLVSTVRGRLRHDVDAVRAVRSCFPGGSMTGAPKLRTMEIIDRLEGQARGVYSGALGYFGLTGAADLSIVIRTAVRWGDTLSVGAGGAIVLDSVAEEEFAEMILKAQTPLRGMPATAPAGPDTGYRRLPAQ